MRIAVLGDTHSRHPTVIRALELARAHGATCVLHCGDIEDAAAVSHFEGLPTHFVLGNCDDDGASLREAIDAVGATLHEPFGRLELDGRTIAWIHGHDQRLFQQLEQSGGYDFLFYGHTHVAEQHHTGRTLVVNPGALHRARVKTFVILDTTDGTLETVVVEPS